MQAAKRPASIAQRFRLLAAEAPGAPALIDGATSRVTTRAALLERASALAARLREAGLKRGDFLAVQLPNSVDFVALFLAALELELTFVPIDRDAREAEVASILNHFSIRGFAWRDGAEPRISMRDVATLAVGEVYVPLLKLSSGSTGTPKGILTSEANLVADCGNICSTMGITPADVNLGAIPFSHSYGFSNLVTPLLLQGTAVVFSNDYLPLSILGLANRHGCTVVPGIPMMFEHLSQLPRDDGTFHRTRTFLSAGAPLTATTSARFRERFGTPVHTFLGCSECGGITYDRTGGAVEEGHVGTPMDNVTLAPDAKGLIVRSDAVALGYLKATAEEAGRFDGGTFRTDDLAEFRESGEVNLVGRIGEMINTAGKKVNPREVETVILRVRGVRQVKVYGEPAGARGEVVAAAVVADPDVTRESIRDYCRQHLSSHKVPRIIKLIEQIPLDERGKVKRSALAEL